MGLFTINGAEFLMYKIVRKLQYSFLDFNQQLGF